MDELKKPNNKAKNSLIPRPPFRKSSRGGSAGQPAPLPPGLRFFPLLGGPLCAVFLLASSHAPGRPAFAAGPPAARPFSPAPVLLAQDDEIDDSDILDIENIKDDELSGEEKDLIEEEGDLDDEDLDEDEEDEDLEDEDLDEDDEEDEDEEEYEDEEDEDEDEEDLEDEDLDEDDEEDEDEEEYEDEEDEDEDEEDEDLEDEDLDEDDEEDEDEEEGEEDDEEDEEEEDLDSDEEAGSEEPPPADLAPPADEDEGDSMSSEDGLGEDESDLAADEDDSGELNLITNIRYLSESDQVVIDCSETVSFQHRTNEQNNQFIIEIFQSKLGRNLHWPYPLKDFNTNFGWIKGDQKDSSTVRILIQLKDGSEFPEAGLSETGRQIIVNFKGGGGRISKSGPEDLDAKQILSAKTLDELMEELYSGRIRFSGAPLSFHVIDAPVEQILRFISEESGINMVIDESVKGKVTLKLEDIPWDQALHTIFKAKDLGYQRDRGSNVITILSMKKIEERNARLQKLARERSLKAPVFVTKIIPIAYADLGDIQSKITPLLTMGAGGGGKDGKGGGKGFDGGRIIPNKQAGTLIVRDTEKKIAEIESLVRVLDEPPKQVMIEARIVDVSENFNKEIGLTWRLSDTLPISINASGLVDFFQGLTGDYSVDKPDKGFGAALNLNGIPFLGDVEANLSIAESEGYARVVSSPKVVTISGKPASLNRTATIYTGVTKTTTQGEGQGAVTTTEPETASIPVSLEVTPTVTSKGSVFLEVNVKRSSPGDGVNIVNVDRDSKTEVLVENGHTVVISGLYEQDESFSNDGIPFLKDIPLLNKIFGGQTNSRSKSELLVFLTPKILDSP